MSSTQDTLQPGQSIKPILTLAQAKELVKVHFGLTVSKIKEIHSYDDRNFYIEIEGDPVAKYILKVLNSMDSRKPGHVEAQHEMMFLLSSKGVKCPVPRRTLDGATFKVVSIPAEENANDSRAPDRPKHLIRLLDFVEGTILHSIPMNAKLFQRSGTYIAQIQQMLKECHFHAFENHSIIWMVGNTMQLEKFVYAIEDHPERYNMVKSILAAFQKNVKPLMPSLEQGVIHGDYNEQNILVQKSKENDNEYDICGLIDFGDSNSSPYVFELAITVCYMMLEAIRCDLDPFEAAGHVVAGYCKVRTVPETEFQLLRVLVASRLATSLVMGAYTYAQDPGNEYLLTTATRGWTLLSQIWNDKSDQQMVSICKKFLTSN